MNKNRITDIEIDNSNDNFISCSVDKEVCLWSLKEQKLLGVFQKAVAASFSCKGFFAVAYQSCDVHSQTRCNTFINIHKIERFEDALVTIPLESTVENMKFNNNGMFLLCSNRNEVIVVDSYTGTLISSFTIQDTICEVVMTPDSRYVIVGTENGKIEIYRVVTGKLITRMSHAGGAMTCLKLAHKHLVMASACKDIILWFP